MTEGSSKGLTWATLVAGVVSAALLAIIGCVKPVQGGDHRTGLRLDRSPFAGAGESAQRFGSHEPPQRPGNSNRQATHR